MFLKPRKCEEMEYIGDSIRRFESEILTISTVQSTLTLKKLAEVMLSKCYYSNALNSIYIHNKINWGNKKQKTMNIFIRHICFQ